MGLIKHLYTVFSDANKSQIDYIVTLGGDGTILWAARQFNTGYIPPMLTFAQGSLGFMCNFTFEDHKTVLGLIFKSIKKRIPPAEIGLENRFRLKVNVGPGTSSERQVFRGDQL
jgi:NAD kinase